MGALYPPAGETETLFQILGTTYGGDGQNNFAVPDLRSLATMAVATNLPIASFAGFQGFMLSVPQLAPHAHALVPEISVEQLAGPVIADGESVDFGQLNATDSGVQKTFTIRNLGAIDLTLGTITKDGMDPSVFTVSMPGESILAPGDSTTFTIMFDPPTAGNRNAAIHIPNNDGDENTFDIPVFGRRLTHLESWRLQYFNTTKNAGTASDTSDFDKDGLTNGVEFAIGSHPKEFTASPGTLTRVGNTLEFVYQRSKAALADGFIFQANFSGDIAVATNWSGNGVTEQIMSEDAQVEVVKASLAILPTQTKGFARLSITPP